MIFCLQTFPGQMVDHMGVFADVLARDLTRLVDENVGFFEWRAFG